MAQDRSRRERGSVMKDKWLVTLEIDTYDGNPAKWTGTLSLQEMMT
jgi:hypothetical protein